MVRRKITGALLLLAGIAICAAGVGLHIAYLHERYQGFAEHGYFSSFAEYFWAVGKANLVCSVIAGSIPAGVGIYLLCTKPWGHVPVEESLK